MGQRVQGQGDIGIKGRGLSAHEEIDDVPEQVRVIIGKFLQGTFAPAGKQSLPFYSPVELTKGNPFTGNRLVGCIGHIGEHGRLDPGDDMTFGVQPALLVNKKIFPQGVDHQVAVAARRPDDGSNFVKIDSLNFVYQPINKPCLVRCYFVPWLQCLSEMLLLLPGNIRTFLKFFAAGNDSGGKGQAGGQQTPAAIGLRQVFVEFQRRQGFFPSIQVVPYGCKTD